MNAWGPKNVVLVMMASGWMVLAGISVFRGGQVPALPVLPLQAPQSTPWAVDRAERAEARELAARHTEPGPTPHHTGPPAEPSYGLRGIEPGSSLATEPLTVSAPLAIYDDGGVTNISIAGEATEALWTAGCVTCNVDSNFIGPLISTSTVSRIECSWETTGTVGSSNATIQVYNVTDAASVCTCAIGACNTAARTPMACNCNGTLLAGKTNVLRLSAKGDCTVAPQTILCTSHLTPP